MASQIEIANPQKASDLVSASAPSSVSSAFPASLRTQAAMGLLVLGILVHLLFIVSLKTG